MPEKIDVKVFHLFKASTDQIYAAWLDPDKVRLWQSTSLQSMGSPATSAKSRSTRKSAASSYSPTCAMASRRGIGARISTRMPAQNRFQLDYARVRRVGPFASSRDDRTSRRRLYRHNCSSIGRQVGRVRKANRRRLELYDAGNQRAAG